MKSIDLTPFDALPPLPSADDIQGPNVAYDDDLGWIMSRYAERTSAIGLLLSVHHADRSPAARLYSYGSCAGDLAIEDAIAGAAEALPHSADENFSKVPHWASIPGSEDDAIPQLLAHDRFHRIALVTLHARGADAASRHSTIYLAERLRPVLVRYFRLWLINLAQRRRLAGLAAALDATDIAIMLFDREANLLFTNDAARGLLDDADGLRRVGASVAATDLQGAVRLRVALQNAIAEPSGREREDSATIVPLRRKIDDRKLIISVTRMTGRPAAPTDPAAIIYVFSPDLDIERQLAPVCAVYSLTKTETRLVALLAGGESVTEAAGLLQCKVSTVRTHLKQIFSKTGTARQGDLIRLMMASLARLRKRGEVIVL